MSDGPYRSLPLPPGWKRVAKCAEKQAFSIDEIGDAVAPALTQDWSRNEVMDVVRSIREIFNDRQESLLTSRSARLAELLPLAGGNDMKQILITCAMRRADAGETGSEALAATTSDTLEIWGARHGRPIEEHYCRKWNAGSADQVRTRIEAGIGMVQLPSLARQLLGVDASRAPRSPAKHTGLEEGPRL